jgi:hypothetical protein
LPPAIACVAVTEAWLLCPERLRHSQRKHRSPWPTRPKYEIVEVRAVVVEAGVRAVRIAKNL